MEVKHYEISIDIQSISLTYIRETWESKLNQPKAIMKAKISEIVYDYHQINVFVTKYKTITTLNKRIFEKCCKRNKISGGL